MGWLKGNEVIEPMADDAMDSTWMHKAWGKPHPDFSGQYHTCEVFLWNQVAPLANWAAEFGYRLHTVRDGLNQNASTGFRLLFERVS